MHVAKSHTRSLRRLVLSGAAAAIMAIPAVASPALALSLRAEPTQTRAEHCTEVDGKGCDDFRKKCTEAGKGITSAGAGNIAVLSCVTIPPPPSD